MASAALVGVNVWTGLTGVQADALQVKVASGDKAALETLMIEARNGNEGAQSDLGEIYSIGQGVPQDYGQAAQWYRKAAEQGYASAQTNLGTLYVFGQGVPQDYGQAEQWSRKAAEQGQAVAQNNLGRLYAIGQGVPQDYGQAEQWWRKAAEQGDVLGLNSLGALYAYGKGVPRSKVVAYALYNLSAALDPSSKGFNNRTSLAKGMTNQEIEAGQALTRKMSDPGHLLQVLDQYLAQPAVKE